MTREERRAYWGEPVARQEASGLSGWAWCAREGVNYASLQRWRRRLAEGPTARPLSWIRVTEAGSGSPLVITVGAARIEVPREFDPVQLRLVVDTLAAR